MHAPNQETSLSKPHRAAGEPFVWITAVGLSLGLLMVIGLLAVLTVNGLKVFWPRKIVFIELRADQPAKFMEATTLAGRIEKEKAKLVTDLEERRKLAAEGRRPMEWQIYVGNKDAFGINYTYVDEEAIARMTYPRDLFVFERLEYGDAIGFPVSLKLEDGAVIPASDGAFFQRLHELTGAATARRKEIERIEKVQIGRINSEMQQLQLARKGEKDAARLAALQEREARLQTSYEGFATQAAALRKEQEATLLSYRLPTGTERSMAVGKLVEFYRPNALSIPQRIGMFFTNLWHFTAEEPREANTEGGVFPAIFGTFVMTLMMSVAVTPFGVLAAIYLREYARQGFFVRSVRIAVNNLAGVPSIVFGVFGLGFFVYFVGGTIDQLFFSKALPTPTFGTGGILWAALTLALMTVPVVIVATEEALVAVPRGMREGSLACGASKWQTIRSIVLPSAVPGILTGLILAMARGAGEVAPLMLVGVVKLAPTLPLDTIFPFFHPERKFMHLGFHIYDLGFQSPDSEAAKPMVFATTFLLIVLVVLLNLTAILIRDRLRRKYAGAAF
jgi:phosphate transport system permease protein